MRNHTTQKKLIDDARKRLLAQFADYESSVTLISSLGQGRCGRCATGAQVRELAPPNNSGEPHARLRRHAHRQHGEWYKLKWRNTPKNQRFTCPNVSADTKVADLNQLLTGKNHCASPPEYTFVLTLPHLREVIRIWAAKAARTSLRKPRAKHARKTRKPDIPGQTFFKY